MTPHSHCIVGCGYVGRRLLQALLSAGMPATGGDVLAVVRTTQSAATVAQLAREFPGTLRDAAMADENAGPGGDPTRGHSRLSGPDVQVIKLDLDVPTTGGKTKSSVPPVTGAVFYLVPPNTDGESDLRLDRFLRLPYWQSDWRPEVFIYMSTTGVYGDCQGAVVDESTPVNPMTDRARRRVNAEEMTRIWCHERQIRRVVLRVPGIYGPGRLPLERLRAGEPLIERSEAGYGNRIHVDDLVAACLAAASLREARGVYNVTDGNPCNVTDYLTRVAMLAGLPSPPRIPLDEARLTFNPRRLSFLEESRQVSNRRMLQDLGVKLRYPDFEGGVKASLRDDD